MLAEEPPCEGCKKPRQWELELWESNVPAWELWSRADRWGRDGWTGKLKLEAVTAYAATIGATPQDVDAALNLELDLWPLIAEQIKRERQ